MSMPDFEASNFVNFFESNSEEVINKLSKEPDKLIKLFEFSCNKNNEWYLKKSDSFDNIFTKIEQLNVDGLLNKSQIKQISDISKSIYPSITNNKTKSELINFLKKTINNDNVYEYLDFLIKNKKMSDAVLCLMFIQKQTGLGFESFDISKLTIDLKIENPKTDQLTQQAKALNNISKIFKEANLKILINEELTIDKNFIKEFMSLINAHESLNIEVNNESKNALFNKLDEISDDDTRKEYINLLQKFLGFKVDDNQNDVIVKIENPSLTPSNIIKISNSLSTIYVNRPIKMILQTTLNVINKLNQSMKEVENLKEASSLNKLALASMSEKIISELTECVEVIRQCSEFKNLEGLNILEDHTEKLIDKIDNEMIRILSIMPNSEMIKAQINDIRESIPSAIKKLEEEEKRIKIEEQKRLRQLEDATGGYLDDYRLLKGESGSKKIQPLHYQWFLTQAVLLEGAGKLTPSQKAQLHQVLLQYYRKAAPSIDSETQTTPLSVETEPGEYYRHGTFKISQNCKEAYAKKIGYPSEALRLVSSPLLREVFQRRFSCPGIDIDSEQKLIQRVDEMTERIIQIGSNTISETNIFDLSDLLANKQPHEWEGEIRRIRQLIRERIQYFQPRTAFARDALANSISCIAFTKYEGQDLLLLDKKDHYFIDQAIEMNGFQPSPSQTLQAWLKVEDANTILKKEGIPIAELATSGTEFPIVCKSYAEFIARAPIQNLAKLSEEPKKIPGFPDRKETPPYLKVLAKATFNLLQGLKDSGIDKTYEEKGMKDLLQISYERILNAAGEAILYQDDFKKFHSRIEFIHQEIEAMLTLVAPYGNKELENSVVANLTSGNSVIPSDLTPKVHLKAGGMRALASTLAGVEAQKGTNKLNVLVLKDSYFETQWNINPIRSYQKYELNGDQLKNEGIIANAITGGNQKTPDKIDLFLCEFHHNLSTARKHYYPENLKDQIKKLNNAGLLADKCTIVIDNTIDLERSEHVRQFLADPEIHQMITGKKLNVVLCRSAQKFDMLGFDNYYGGIVTTINDPTAFNQFNIRMNHPQDQLSDLNYQGLTHLQKYGEIDNYRKAINENAKKLYRKIPQSLIYPSNKPIQVAKMEDDNLYFLHIRFENDFVIPSTYTHGCQKEFKERLIKFANENHLPLTSRGSFGFATTNIVPFDVGRLSPGLEDEKTLDRYADFFKAIDNLLIQQSYLKGEQLADAIKNLYIP